VVRSRVRCIHLGLRDYPVIKFQMKLNSFISSVVSERVAALAVTLSTTVYWLAILTFPDFFFFNPLANMDPVFKIEQIISTMGWVCMGVFPAVFAWIPSIKGRSTQPLYIFSALLWPVSIFIIQATLLVQGSGFYGYLANYPILIFTDVLNCLFLVLLGTQIFKSRNNS